MHVRMRRYRLRLRTTVSVISVLLSLCGFALASGPTNNYRLDALYADSSGSVSAVLQIPDDLMSDALSFQLLEDGEATVSSSKVTPLKQSEWQLSLIICVDTSGSMKGRPTEEVKAALKKLLTGNDIRDTDEVALRTFDDSTRQIWWFDTKQGRITEAIDALRARGNWTVLYNALYAALNDFASKPEKSRNIRRILLISDGKNDVDQSDSNAATPNHSLAEVRTLAQNLNIPIDFLARVRRDRIKEDLEEGNVQEVRALSDLTGGYFEYAEPDQVYIKVRAILERIMAKPVVSFQREINDTAELTKVAGIAHGNWRQELPNTIGRTLKQPEQTPVTSTLPPPEPEPRVPSWLLWLLTFAAIILFAFLTLRTRKDKTPIAQPEPIKTGQPLTPEPESSQPNERITACSPLPHTTDTADDTDRGSVTISLNCIGGPAAGNSYPFMLNKIHIGSDETLENDLCVSEDEHMSAKHAKIEIRGDSTLITDLNSTNGTLLNGKHLDPDVATPFRSGDQIQVGMSMFEIYTSSMGSSKDK